ncbi:MAG: proteasome assembly chaperone family protein [Candidatus Thermoplasmatota archaeon]|nr:proteasome assembly chaperone family protein [Candidatus Thermoplasmatota archaeon]
MEDVIIESIEEPKLANPILVVGLPGVGNVGKLAAEHMIYELKAKKFASIYSRNFPPQVFVNEDGTARLVSNDFYYIKAKKQNIMLLTGDYQGLTPEGQYDLAGAALDLVSKYGVKKIFTLGGYSTGRKTNSPRVFGATTDKKLVPELKKFGITFSPGEPGGGIIGASGLLIGLGKLRGIEGACLMGETAGYLVDPKSSRSVLEMLRKILGIDINVEELDVRAKQMDKVMAQLEKMNKQADKPSAEDLKYIG